MGERTAEKKTNLVESANNLKDSAVLKPETNLRESKRSGDKGLFVGWAALDRVEAYKELRKEWMVVLSKIAVEEKWPKDKLEEKMTRVLPHLNSAAISVMGFFEESKEMIAEFKESAAKTEKEDIEAFVKKILEDQAALEKNKGV